MTAPTKQPASAAGRLAEPGRTRRSAAASRAPTHSGLKARSGFSSRSRPCGASTAGSATAARRQRTRATAHTTAPVPRRRPPRVAAVAATAASRTRPSRPMPRSTSTTDAASVRERAGLAVSAIRTTSPPMLLGRKLLKNVATRNDSVSARAAHVHALRVEQQAPAPGAREHHQEVQRPAPRRATAIDAERA